MDKKQSANNEKKVSVANFNVVFMRVRYWIILTLF